MIVYTKRHFRLANETDIIFKVWVRHIHVYIYIRMGLLSLDALWLIIIPIKFQRVSICSLISEKYVLLDNKHRTIGIMDHLIITKSSSFRLRHLVLINGFKIVVHIMHIIVTGVK